MLRIMILDDEELYLEKEKKITEEYFAQQGLPCQVETCQNTEWFLMGLKEEKYDIYILDVEMPEKNGLEVAREIRKVYPEPIFIFVTNYMEYAVDAYEVNTYRYIPKLQLEPKLTKAYTTLLPQILEKEEKYYVIEKKGVVEKIAYSDIYYLKKEVKYVVFIHRYGESRVRKSMKGVLEELNSEEFIIVDKGYIINIRHVMKIENHELYMRNDKVLPVGAARYKKVRQTIMSFWR